VTWRRPAAAEIGAAGLALLLAAAALLPLGRLLLEAAFPRGGSFDLAIAERLLASPTVWRAFWRTIDLAGWSTAISLTLGVTLAFLATLTDLRTRGWVIAIVLAPLVVAPQVTALAWMQMTGPGSPLLGALGLAPPIGRPNPLVSREGVILLVGLEHVPLVYLAARAGLRQIPAEQVEAARGLGHTPATVVWRVLLPLVAPAIAAGGALAFVSAVGNFGIPAMLGIPARYTVLTTLVYERLSGFGPRVLPEVATLSVLLAAIALAGTALAHRLGTRVEVRQQTSRPLDRPFALGTARPLVDMAVITLALATVALPLVSLVAAALVPAIGVAITWETITSAHFRFVLADYPAGWRAIRNSLGLAATAAILLGLVAVLHGWLLVWRRNKALARVDPLLELPYAVPGIVLAIALILLLLRPLPVINVSLYNTAVILLVAYLVRFLPLALRPVGAAYRQFDPQWEEAARLAGLGPIRRFVGLLLPLAAPAAIAGGLLVFLSAATELTLSALLWSSGNETLGVVVFQLEQGGDSPSAAAMACVTVAVAVAALGLLGLVGRRLPAGVLPWRD
jgi:iron(III) transport system permease protein